MKIKTKNRSLFGNKLIVPFDGLVTIDGNGIVEVSDSAAENLLLDSGWEPAEKVDEPDREETKKEAEARLAEEAKQEEKEIIAGIKAMELPQLIEMAKEAGYPEEEWSKHKENAKLLSGYLVGKFKASKK